MTMTATPNPIFNVELLLGAAGEDGDDVGLAYDDDDDDDDDEDDDLSSVSDNESEDGDDDDDDRSSSSDDSSLGAKLLREGFTPTCPPDQKLGPGTTKTRAKGKASPAASASRALGTVRRKNSHKSLVSLGTNSVKSMPNLQNHKIQLDLGADANTLDLSCSESLALDNFMKRVNSCKSLTYYQDVKDQNTVVPMSVEIRQTTTGTTSSSGDGRRRASTTTQDDMALNNLQQQSPAQRLEEVLEGLSKVEFSEQYWENYFEPISAERVRNYSKAVPAMTAIRGEDLAKLKQLYHQEGMDLNGCNAQGESLIHLACRRRNHDLVHFMVTEVKNLSVTVRDDWGKTPLHELCWNSRTKDKGQFQSFKLIFGEAPELLFCQDKRGFSPLQYVPKSCWKEWGQFLDRYRTMIRTKARLISFAQSSSSLHETLQKAELTISSMKKSMKN